MSEPTLHRGEVVAAAHTVRQLVDTQFPAGRSLPLRRLRTDGAIYRWLPGEDAATAVLGDQRRFAHELADFVGALHRVDVTAVAAPDRPHWYRCDPIFDRDRHTRDNLRRCRQLAGLEIDLELVERIWDDAMGLPPSGQAACWVHTDLSPFNVLVADGRLSAVIDFGGLAVGDPVIDLSGPWGLLSAAGRSAFRIALGVDEVCWRHARAWALTLAVGVLPYYWRTLPSFVAYGLRQLREVIDDYRREGG